MNLTLVNDDRHAGTGDGCHHMGRGIAFKMAVMGCIGRHPGKGIQDIFLHIRIRALVDGQASRGVRIVQHQKAVLHTTFRNYGTDTAGEINEFSPAVAVHFKLPLWHGPVLTCAV